MMGKTNLTISPEKTPWKGAAGCPVKAQRASAEAISVKAGRKEAPFRLPSAQRVRLPSARLQRLLEVCRILSEKGEILPIRQIHMLEDHVIDQKREDFARRL